MTFKFGSLAIAIVVAVSAVAVYHSQSGPMATSNTPHAKDVVEQRVRPSLSTASYGEDAISLHKSVKQERVPRREADEAYDEAKQRRQLQDFAVTHIQKNYSFLVDELGLETGEKDQLTKFLISDLMAHAGTLYVRAKPQSLIERSQRIRTIIGDSNTKRFLDLEKNLVCYRDAQQLATALEVNQVPFERDQQHRFLQILIETNRDDSSTVPGKTLSSPEDAALERVRKANEYERHVLERAVSVLSAEQLRLLDDQYQYRASKRLASVESQRRWISSHPEVKVPIVYPAL